MTFPAELETLALPLLKQGLKNIPLSDEHAKLVRRIVLEALESRDQAGMIEIQQVFMDLMNGKNPDLSWVSPRSASDLVAAMQNAEADVKEKMAGTVGKIGEVVKQVGVALVKLALAALV